MDTDVRKYFDRAVSGDPGADLGEMARAAIAEGGRVRRRRQQMAVAGVAAGVVMVLAVVVGVNHRSPATAPENPAAVAPVSVAPPMTLVAAVDCAEQPVPSEATDIVIIPGDADGHVTDQMVSRLSSDLKNDPRVATVLFETREQAYQRFKKLWADYPDFVASVTPDSLAEFFRLRLVDAAQSIAFRTQYAARADVSVILGFRCRPSAPVGGVQ